MIRTALFFAAPLLYAALRTRRAVRRRGLTYAVNIGEGFSETGAKGFYPDVAFPSRYLLAKAGSSGTNVALCGAADVPVGGVYGPDRRGDAGQL